MSADARGRISEEEFARALRPGPGLETSGKTWAELRYALVADVTRREQARKRQERRVLARLLLASRRS